MVCVSTQRTPHNILWAFALLCRSACAYIRIHNTHAHSVSNRRKCPTSRRAPCWGSIDRDATHSQHMFPMGSFRLKNSIFENESIMIKIEQAYRGELSVSKIVSNLWIVTLFYVAAHTARTGWTLPQLCIHFATVSVYTYVTASPIFLPALWREARD